MMDIDVAAFIFRNLKELLRVLVVGASGYVLLIVFLRISGKRTLTKMNAFDLVVTVALGSTLATMLLSQSVTLAGGLTAAALLIGLQYVVTFVSIRSPSFRHIVKSEPTMIFHKGDFLRSAMKRERIPEEEIYAAARKAGVKSMDDIQAVVLETDGDLSVILKTDEETEPGRARSTYSDLVS